jgi:hypothetical protein
MWWGRQGRAVILVSICLFGSCYTNPAAPTTRPPSSIPPTPA